MKKHGFVIAALTVVIGVALAASVNAQLLSENFDGTVGSSIISISPWGPVYGDYVISGTTIDSGNSAGTPGGDRFNYRYLSSAYNLAAGETVSLTAVAKNNSGSSLGIAIMRGDGLWANFTRMYSVWTGGLQGFHLMDFPAVGDPYSEQVSFAGVTQGPVEMKISVSAAGTRFYYRAYGATDWVQAGTGSTYATGTVTGININAEYAGAGYLDTLRLTAEVPEPSAILALGSGLLGLSGFAIRRRK